MGLSVTRKFYLCSFGFDFNNLEENACHLVRLKLVFFLIWFVWNLRMNVINLNLSILKLHKYVLKDALMLTLIFLSAYAVDVLEFALCITYAYQIWLNTRFICLKIE